MSFIDKIKNGLRATKWIVSKNGREYRKRQKTEQEGIKLACQSHENCDEDHKEEEEK